MDLLGDSDSDENEASESLTINKKYAQSYDRWRKKEERQKLIDKYGDDVDSESSSEEEEIRSTPQLDKDWLRAYAIVRFNQPRLYTGEHLFREEVKPVVKKTEKAETLKDYERRFILEKGGRVESDDESDSDIQRPETFGKTYMEEQEEIKDSFKAALHDLDSDADDGEGKDSLLVKKMKTEEQRRKEENDYLEWLKGEREDLDDKQAAEELAPLKAYWNDPNLTEKERVLRDYILNNGYMDREESEDESDSDEGPDMEEEEEFLEKAEEYEHKYNFRHEEPGGTEIKSYPRVIETSVRSKDSRRAEKRQRRMEKRKQEQKEKQEEIRLLQKLQKEEREEKLLKLRNISENPDLNYDLDADFDPDEHSKIMEKYFNDEYYGDEAHGSKPVFEYDEAIDDETEDWWYQQSQNQLKEEEAQGNDEEEYYDGKFIMDADYDANIDYKSKSKKEKREKKKKGKAAKRKPAFDPSSKSFDEFVDEYLKDKINTLPFPYREVLPNNFGLSTEEILTAKDRELNAWVSVKKMSMYRSHHEERMDVDKFNVKAQNLTSKYKKLPSLLAEPEDGAPVKKKKKKKRRKNRDSSDIDEPEKEDIDESPLSNHVDIESSDLKGTKRKISKVENQMPQEKKNQKILDDISDTPNVMSPKKKRKKGEVNSGWITSPLPSSPNLNMKSIDDPDVQSLKNKNKKKDVNKSIDSSRQNQTKKGKMKNKNLKQNSAKKNVVVSSAGDIAKTNDKPATNAEAEVDSSQSKAPPSSEGKKKKSKKLKLRLDHSSTTSGQKVTAADKKTRKEDLKKVMSSYRLSKYGIGPTIVKDANPVKKKKKKKKKVVNSS